jgi:ubiquinone/menaquinone biosynthesis C-methylase UbiE
MARLDYEHVGCRYDKGRGPSLEAIEPWRVALADYLPPTDGLPILDVGSGTGQFATAFVHWFDATVIGVEPAAAMRNEARRKIPAPSILLLGGRAEELPLHDATCGCAWLSTVIHHIADLRRCASELRRVLRGDARVLIRSAFPGHHDRITLFRYFAAARRVAETFPSIEHVQLSFASEGFEREALKSVSQTTAPDLRACIARVKLMRDADSTLAPISDEEFAQGLAAMEKSARDPTTSGPVVDWLDLLVLRRRP